MIQHHKNCSNNTNKLSPQEPSIVITPNPSCSNNTNKLSPQELTLEEAKEKYVQIIQINLVLKNGLSLRLKDGAFK